MLIPVYSGWAVGQPQIPLMPVDTILARRVGNASEDMMRAIFLEARSQAVCLFYNPSGHGAFDTMCETPRIAIEGIVLIQR